MQKVVVVIALLAAMAGMALAQTMSGTYTIKADGSGDFPSLVAAASALNSRGLSGSVVFNISAGAYSEGTVNLTVNTSTYSVTWQALPGQMVLVSAPGDAYVFSATASNRHKLKDLTLGDCTQWGVRLSNSDAWRIDHCSIYSPQGCSLSVGSDADTISRCDVRVTGAYGIVSYNTAASNFHCFMNNFISGWTTSGIGIINHAGTTIYNNTIYGLFTGQFCVNDSLGSNVDVRNNVFRNDYPSSSAVSYAKRRGGALTLNYNCHWNPNYPTGSCLYISGTGSYLNLAGMRSLGYEVNGIQRDPLIGGRFNLHLKTGSPCVDSGATVASVSVDIDGTTRPSGPAYDIGADEFTGVGVPMNGIYSIRQDGLGDFTSFNSGLSALALRGQSGSVTFDVYGGVYYEYLNLDGWTSSPYWVSYIGHAGQSVLLNAGQSSSAAYLRANTRWRFQNIEFTNYQDYGVYFDARTTSPYKGCDTCVVSGCRFTGPSGIYLYFRAAADSILGNYFTLSGPYGIYGNGNPATPSAPYINRLVIANNMIAGWTTNGIRLSRHTRTELYHNTVFNAAATSQFCIYDSAAYDTMRALNNIYLNNYSSVNGAGYGKYYPQTGSMFVTNYNCYYNQTYPTAYCMYHSTNGWQTLAGMRGLGWENNGMQRNPLLGGTMNLHLKAGSPCIDSGLAITGIDRDIDGNVRPQGARVDVGADEFVSAGSPMSGVYTVNQQGGGDFLSIHDALGAVQLRGLAGNVRFDIYEGIYRGPVRVRDIANAGFQLAFRGVPGQRVVIDAGGASYGFDIYQNRKIHIEGLRILGFASYGIYATSGSTTVNTCDSCAVVGNFILGPVGIAWYYGSTDSFVGNTVQATSSYGMYIYGNTASPYGLRNVVINNMVSGATSYGIYAAYHSGIKFFYNTCYLTGSATGIQARYLYNDSMVNNIIEGGTNYAYYRYHGSEGLTRPAYSDYNDFMRYDGNTTINYYYYSSAGHTYSLATWRSSVQRDTHSISVNPQVLGASNLHLLNTSPCINVGRVLPAITRDIDGDTRSGLVDIGADEYFLDVACRSVVAPTGNYPVNAAVTPSAAFRHMSGTAGTYYVKMAIDRAGTPVYADSAVRTTSPGDSFVQPFRACTLTVANPSYHAVATVRLSGDQNAGNDTARSTFSVSAQDMAVVGIIAPTGIVSDSSVIRPAVRVRNAGASTSICTLRVTIDDGLDLPGPARPLGRIARAARTATPPGDAIVYDQSVVLSVPAGVETLWTFATPWTATPPRNYTVRARTATPGDQNPANDTLSALFTVHRYDLGAVAIIAPTGSVLPGIPVTPQARLHNFGSVRTAATATFEINSPSPYHSTVDLPSGLPIGIDTIVAFANWTAEAGNLAAMCSTWTGGDQRHVNDAVRSAFTVGGYDVGILGIVAPVGTVNDGAPVFPKARVKNWGTYAAACTLRFSIENGAASGDRTEGRSPEFRAGGSAVKRGKPVGDAVVYDQFAVLTLQSGAESIYTFTTSWQATPPGGYLARARSVWLQDQNPANDTTSVTFTVVPTTSDTGWVRRVDLPPGTKGKSVKDGGCITDLEATDAATFIYGLKGNGRCEFYQYSIAGNAWEAKESIPAVGSSGKKKAVKKGASITDADGVIFAAKGNGTLEWWKYDPALSGSPTYPWTEKTSVPTGAKVIKEGSGSAMVKVGDTTFIYFLKGSSTQEFYRYNVGTGTWSTPLSPAPLGTSGKPWKNGSCLTAEDDWETPITIYAVKGSYNEFYAYDVATNTWTTKTPLPMTGSSGKKKKVKDGAGLAFLNNTVYCLKGGGTREFWTYEADSDQWTQLEDIPLGGGKPVKGGGALTRANDKLFAFKGNNTLEFYSYAPASAVSREQIAGSSAQTGDAQRAPAFSLSVSPTLFRTGATIHYSLPRAGNYSLKLYDITGQLVTTLASGYHNAGTSSLRLSPSSLSSGIYVLKLTTDGSTTTAKLIVE